MKLINFDQLPQTGSGFTWELQYRALGSPSDGWISTISHELQATATSLTPGTKYFFRCRSGALVRGTSARGSSR